MARATRDELIAYLQTLPEDVILQVCCEESRDWYTCVIVEDLDLDPYTGNVEVMDMRGNPHVTPDRESYGKVYLQFGEN